MAVNDTWRLIDADHLYAADCHWWSYHVSDVARDFDGQCWTCETGDGSNWKHKGKDPAAWGITALRCQTDGEGLHRDPDWVNGGGNSGYQAINLAYHLGASRVILLGFDMTCHSGKSHWFGDHPKAFSSNTKYERFIKRYRTINPADYGLEILNCSRTTALDAFPRHCLDDL